ncbi:MAG TPA: amidase [Pseudonocardiaceae bacterium]|nr:amidase [Pseudonocardiaceae bacterium]
MTDLLDLPVVAQRELIACGELSPVELMERTLARIEQRNPRLNAIVTLRAEAALAEAVAATRSRPAVLPPLYGIPFTVKDTIEVAGVRTTAGSRLLADNVPARTATAVARIQAAGAILVGRTLASEFGMGNLEACSPLFGQARNPWDPARTPGGSSGGDSVAVAAGLAGFGVGTDYGGSVRFPAHCTGIAALRPTPGRIPAEGMLPQQSFRPPPVRRSLVQRELQTIGFLTRAVADLAVLLRVTSGEGPAPAMPIRCAWFVDDVPAEVAATVRAAANALAGFGIEVSNRMPPGFLDAAGLLGEARAAEGLPEIAWLAEGRVSELGPVVAAALAAPIVPTPDLRPRISLLRKRIDEFLADCPILLMPVAAGPAFQIVDGPPPPRPDFDLCTRAVTLLRLPAAVVAVGTSAPGLPLGVQVAGRPGHDEQVLAVAELLEQSFGRWRPTGSTPR